MATLDGDPLIVWGGSTRASGPSGLLLGHFPRLVRCPTAGRRAGRYRPLKLSDGPEKRKHERLHGESLPANVMCSRTNSTAIPASVNSRSRTPTGKRHRGRGRPERQITSKTSTGVSRIRARAGSRALGAPPSSAPSPVPDQFGPTRPGDQQSQDHHAAHDHGNTPSGPAPVAAHHQHAPYRPHPWRRGWGAGPKVPRSGDPRGTPAPAEASRVTEWASPSPRPAAGPSPGSHPLR